jgi:Abortive infection C-terminus
MMSMRVVNPDGGGHFVVPRLGDVDIELTGTHLACVEEVADSDEQEEGEERVDRRLSLYRATNGKYVLAYSGTHGHDWGSVHDSAQDVASALFDQNGFLHELEKLLLREAANKDARIAPFSRIDLRADDIRELALSVARASQTVDSSTLYEHLRRIEQSLESDPGQAIGSAKELLETVGKQILDHYGQNTQQSSDMPKLMSSAFKCLKLSEEDIPQSVRGAEAIKKVFAGLNQVASGTAELRNLYGTGHGRSRKGGASARHARLVIGAAATLSRFLLETLDARSAEERPLR